MPTDLMFVELLYRSNLKNLEYLNQYFLDLVYKIKNENKDNYTNWYCNTFSTIGHYNLKLDHNFKNYLHVNFVEEIKKFSKDFFYEPKDIICNLAWINLSKPGSYQEFHIHSESHFSICYYINVNPKSGKIIFRSHEANTDMLPLPNSKDLPFSKNFSFEPKNNDLLIFRSNQQHAVMLNESTEDRISISANYTIGK